MIHLDSRSGEKDKILELINFSVDKTNNELECLFYDDINNIRNPKINHTNFISLLKRYKSNPNFISKTHDRLTLSLDNEKYSNVRILIKGSGSIKNYCNNENINLIRNNVDFEFKLSPKGLNRLQVNNYNFRFNLKEENNFNNDETRINDILREIKTIPKSYRYKKIFSFKKKTNDFQVDISIVKSSNLLDNKFLTVKEIIEQKKERDVEKPKDIKLNYTTWWNSIKDKPTELVKIKNSINYFKTIKESNVFTNLPHYEAEIEYIKNKHYVNPNFKTIDLRKDYIQTEFVNYFKEIGSILQCLQNSFYILSNDEIYSIKKQFTKVVENSINEKMLEQHFKNTQKNSQTKQSIPKQKGGTSDSVGNSNLEFTLTPDNDINFDKQIQMQTLKGGTKQITGYSDIKYDDDSNITNPNGGSIKTKPDDDYSSEEEKDKEEHTKMIGGTKILSELKNNIINNFRYKDIFFGPNIIDLSHNNSNYIDTSAMPNPRTNTNIHINYLVTDKTDGDRNLLFFNENGQAYGISRTSQLKYFGIIIPSLANTILDGEYINRSHEDKMLNQFYIFDSYIYKGENVMIKQFLYSKKGGLDGRYDTILNSIKAFTEGTNIIQLNSKLPFLLYKKEYMMGDTTQSYLNIRKKDKQSLMSENCENILNKMNVKYGGFSEVGHLFPYKTDGLVFHPNNLSVFQTTMDSYIENPFVAGRWNNNYKWKAQDQLTIDFKIKIIKDIVSSKPAYSYFGNKKYIKVNLLTHIYHNNKKHKDDNNRLNFYLINAGKKLSNLSSELTFLSTSPFIGYYDNDGEEHNQMGETYLEVDGNDNIICSDGSIITDNIICECSYDLNKEVEHRWIPERIRPDKTTPNVYLTANTAWMLINNPITKEHLINKSKQSIIKNTEINTNDSALIEKDLKMKDYYSSKDKTDLYVKPLNKFNNFVKDYLISRALSGYTKPNVLDLAVGEFGDLDKYIKNGVNHLLGIDINEYNLNNPLKGAATRIMNASLKFNNSQYSKFSEKVILINGTGTKNIANGDCVFDNLNKYYIDVLYGRAKGNTPKLRKMEGVGLDSYDLITCMYAIHYMMNDEISLDNFLRNVSENLLDQGYFIGTCLDGMEILKALGHQKEITGDIDDKRVFYIRKESEDDDYKTITVGNKINVFFETFDTSFTENLVSISYLEAKAKQHNLKLVEFKGLLDEPGNMLSKYATDGNYMGKENAKQIKESNAMMTWSKFNSYFIFQKVRSDEEM